MGDGMSNTNSKITHDNCQKIEHSQLDDQQKSEREAFDQKVGKIHLTESPANHLTQTMGAFLIYTTRSFPAVIAT